MNIAIIAAGSATRLGDMCKNVPKCMLTIGGKPGIDHLMEKLPWQDAHLVVVTSPDFRGELLKAYMMKKYPARMTFVEQPEPIGTADAVARTVPFLGESPTLFVWSDIFPRSNVEIPDVDTVFTTRDFPCRYAFKDGTVKKEGDGNVIGMYYIKSPIGELVKEGDKQDFADVLQGSGIVFGETSIECYDFGRLDTLTKTRNEFETSAYAVLRRDGGNILKLYSAAGADLFNKEALWYAHAPVSVHRYIPQVRSVNWKARSLVMQFVYGESATMSCPDAMKEFLNHLVFVLAEYFHANKYPVDRESLHTEYVANVIKRCLDVLVTPGLCEPLLRINGQEYHNPVIWLAKPSFAKRLVNFLAPESFTFIHGDPTLQNMKIVNGHVCLFDPKAQFGGLYLFGDPKYDFAKMYYSFAGNYDGFNMGQYRLEAGKEFSYEVMEARHSHLGEWYLNYLHRSLGYDPVAIKIIHALIWLRVTGYVWPKSIEQAIVAFLHGTVLFSEAMEEVEWFGGKA